MNNRTNNRNNRKGRFFMKKQYCYLTRKQITYIDYKDIDLLKRFLSHSGQILPRQFTGTKCKYQKHLAKAIKRARFLGLLPYVVRSSNN